MTNLVYGRFFPDPLGIVLWYGKLEFGALARSAIASPRGKLSSAARLMRNGEMNRFCMRYVKKVQFERLYGFI